MPWLPKEIVFEIYSHLGNTDKRRLRQTSTLYDIKFKEKSLLKELIKDGYDIPDKYLYNYVNRIVKHGRLDLIKKTRTGRLCHLAASYGQLNILIWAHETGHPWDKSTCDKAAHHLMCLKYLHENGCPWDEYTCMYAAKGHLGCLKYAHEQGCPWDKWTCIVAAQGDLECLKYAHEHGCPWDKEVCQAAAEGYLDCLKYAHEQGCLWDKSVCTSAV